jgi:hypothetical protein
MRYVPLTWIFCLATVGCGESKKPPTDTPASTPVYRYLDRELYLPTGSAVSPEETAAQEVIRAALEDLEQSTDLGAGYFLYRYDDDSILQPVAARTQSAGRQWHSFIQAWEDDLINDYLAQAGGDNPDGDQDIIVAANKLDARQYFIVTRLSCFLSGASCGLASQVQAKMLVWRAYGYLIGLRVGTSAASAVMRPAVDPDQELAEERRKFIAEFNARLELIRNNMRVHAL